MTKPLSSVRLFTIESRLITLTDLFNDHNLTSEKLSVLEDLLQKLNKEEHETTISQLISEFSKELLEERKEYIAYLIGQKKRQEKRPWYFKLLDIVDSESISTLFAIIILISIGRCTYLSSLEKNSHPQVLYHTLINSQCSLYDTKQQHDQRYRVFCGQEILHNEDEAFIQPSLSLLIQMSRETREHIFFSFKEAIK